jgi:serine/threonine protein kinase
MKFIAPELFREEKLTDKADMYSLGATYYYMLYGKQPSKDKLEFPENVPVSYDAKQFTMKSLSV